MGKIPVVAVLGPTAVGKTRLAAALAKKFGGEVVSADSMQIYRGLPVGTAQPGREEMLGVPHHLIGFLDPSKPFSVADYRELASRIIREIRARGRLPFVAGGTGLYLDALLSNLRFAPGGRDESLRQKLRKRIGEEGPEPLLRELRSFDPRSADRIDPQNTGRLIRAVEIYRTTGLTMTEQIERSRKDPPPYDICRIGLSFRSRAGLYEAINRRVDRMMSDGLLEEARRVLSLDGAPTAAQAIGYKEFGPYFSGERTLPEAVEEVKLRSRQYAKRQLTWFRREPDVRWLYREDFPDFSSLLSGASRIVEEKGWKL